MRHINPSLMLAAAYGTILEQKRSNQWGRYHIRAADEPRRFIAVRRDNSRYTGEKLREIRKTRR